VVAKLGLSSSDDRVRFAPQKPVKFFQFDYSLFGLDGLILYKNHASKAEDYELFFFLKDKENIDLATDQLRIKFKDVEKMISKKGGFAVLCSLGQTSVCFLSDKSLSDPFKLTALIIRNRN
jgi:hypothetical protein